jgi:hypothetical protein
MLKIELTIEPAGSKDIGVCECCGRSSRRVWGYAYAADQCVAAYFVHWTLGHIPDQGANIDLILGEWGDTASSDQRSAIALAYRLLDNGPAMMVIDADGRDIATSDLVGRVLRRDQIVGTEMAQEAFSVADAILAQDARVMELLGDPGFSH